MKRTEQSLLEQMQIGDVEILRRMELLDLNNAELKLLAGFKFVIEDNIDIIVDEFYEKQTEIDEISLLIGDMDTLKRLRSAQRKYVLDLFSGFYDGEYVNNRLRIGLVHKRIGVEPKLYLSAIRTLKEIIIKTLTQQMSKQDTLWQVTTALDKLLYFDTTLVFDTYIDSLVEEIQTAKKRTEMYAKSLEEKVAERTRQLEEQTKRDPLTNLFNQRALQELLRRELLMAKRRQKPISLLYFDVDDFKKINDIHGHIKGDEVLKGVGQILLNNIREVDLPFRYGGDEFCLILVDCGKDDAVKVAEKIIEEFADKYPDFFLSIGVEQTGTQDYLDSEELVKAADTKMYLAKKEPGSSIVV